MAIVDQPARFVPRTRTYDTADLKRLIGFYLTCIETEDRRSLRLPASSYGKSFIAPWTANEPLLHPAADHVDLVPQNDVELSFLTSAEGQAGTPERLFYGFPLLLDADDYLAPLFILEIEITRDGDRFRLLPVDPNALTVNRHLLGMHQLPLDVYGG